MNKALGEPDRSAVDAFFDSTLGVQWKNKRGWTEEDNEVMHGVIFSGPGPITSLSLQNNNLAGESVASLWKG